MVLPGSAVPVMAGVALLIVPRLLMAGAFGAVVSITAVTVLEVGLLLPAVSFWVAVNAVVPSDIGVVGVKLQLPLASTTAVPIGLPLALMVTTAPGSPVPEIVGVLSPLGLGSELITGAVGALVSTTIV